MKKHIRRLIFFVGVLLVWQLLSTYRQGEMAMLPGPGQVAASLWGMLADGSLVSSVAVSLRRVCSGFALSLLIGVPLGIVIARNEWLEDTLGALVAALQSLPSICWLPLALLWFGLNDAAILFVVVMGSLVSVTVAVKDGVHNLPSGYVRAARTMGVSGLAMYRDVLLPASMPAVLAGVKQGWAYAWRALMSGELLFVSVGLGHLLMMGRELADLAQVLSVMVVIALLGLFTDRVVFGNLESYVRDRYGLGRA